MSALQQFLLLPLSLFELHHLLSSCLFPLPAPSALKSPTSFFKAHQRYNPAHWLRTRQTIWTAYIKTPPSIENRSHHTLPKFDPLQQPHFSPLSPHKPVLTATTCLNLIVLLFSWVCLLRIHVLISSRNTLEPAHFTHFSRLLAQFQWRTPPPSPSPLITIMIITMTTT